MSWGLGWKRPSDVFHLALNYGAEETLDDRGSRTPSASSSSRSSSPPLSSSSRSSSASAIVDQELGFRIDLDWTAGADDEDQVALRLQSQLMVALPLPQDTVVVELKELESCGDRAGDGEKVGVEMKVVKRREPLKAVTMTRVGGTGQMSDGIGVFTRLLRSNSVAAGTGSGGSGEGVAVVGGYPADHWMSVTVVSLCGCGMSVSVFSSDLCVCIVA